MKDWGGYPKWLDRLLLASLFLLLLLAYSGFLQAESITPQLTKLQNKYSSLTEKLNSLAILSEQDMIKLQAQLPGLIVEVQELSQSVSQLQQEAKDLQVQADGLNLELQTLRQQLTGLKTEIEKLSASLVNSERLMKVFTSQIKAMKMRTDTGLILSVTALIIGVGLAGYSIYNNMQEAK